MKTKIQCVSFLILIVLSLTPGFTDELKGDAQIVLSAEYTYLAGNMDTPERSRALALFGAKKKAIEVTAKRFIQKGLIKNYGKQADEIFCLATNKIKTQILKETFAEKEKRYFIKIKSEVNISDFIEAEIENQVLEKEESDFPWKEEMEQHVSETIDPGRELSRAYRYIRKDQARIAVIYLDHMVKKYANWADVYYLRALGFHRMHYLDQMMKDLEKACSLNYQEACNELHVLR